MGDGSPESYEAQLRRGLSLSGESREYFVEQRLGCLRGRLGDLEHVVGAVLDFGCGDGSSTPWLRSRLEAREVVGVDSSAESLAEAREQHGGEAAQFLAPGALPAAARFSLAHCNGVFHHLALDERGPAASYVFERLEAGAPFAFFENNPWNPGTRWVMARIPFDRDALPLSPPEARALLRGAGFEVLSTSYLFFFPRCLSWLRPLEGWLSWFPLGAQYLVLARKPRAAERPSEASEG